MTDQSKDTFNVWEGIYSSWDEAPNKESAQVFDGPTWIKRTQSQVTDSLDKIDDKSSISPVTLTHDYILPLVVSLTKAKGKSIRILDFGGSLGVSYLKTISSIPEHKEIEFIIVEHKEICSAGEDIFRDFSNIYFQSELDLVSGQLDIIHIGSTLQYIDGWLELIEALLKKHQPQYLILSDLTAGDIESFVTLQNYYGNQMRARFWNFEEFNQGIKSLSCNLLYRAQYQGSYFGQRGDIPMDNFPETHRLKNTCQLLYQYCIGN